MDAETVPQVGAVLQQLLVKCPRVLWASEDDLLDLGELVDAPYAEVTLAVTTDLATETLRDADHSHGHLLFGDGFVHVHRGERVLGGGDHVVFIRLNAVHHGLEVTQIGDAFVGLPVHHHGWLDKGVVALAKELHGVLLEGEFKACEVALEEVESTSGDFGRPLEVNPLVHLDELVVGARLKGKFRFRSVNGVNGVARFVFAHWNVRVEDVRNRHAQAVANLHRFVGLGFECCNALAQIGNLCEDLLSRFLVTGFLAAPMPRAASFFSRRSWSVSWSRLRHAWSSSITFSMLS